MMWLHIWLTAATERKFQAHDIHLCWHMSDKHHISCHTSHVFQLPVSQVLQFYQKWNYINMFWTYEEEPCGIMNNIMTGLLNISTGIFFFVSFGSHLSYSSIPALHFM